jgi:tRNA threonylcarbamoyladenosine biosynthesis protein TsaE
MLATFLPDEAATLALGAALAEALAPGLMVYLRGELGAGKTTLARGVLRALGWQGPVKSPTYTLVEVYELSRLHLHHFDFYRFHDPREWSDAGFRESFNGRNVSLIEWPEKAGDLLPPPDVEIVLASSGDGRNASLRARSDPGRQCLTPGYRSTTPSTVRCASLQIVSARCSSLMKL